MRLLLTGATGFVGRNLLLRALPDPRWEEIVLPVRDPSKLSAQFDAEGLGALSSRVRVVGCGAPRWEGLQADGITHAVHAAAVLFSRDGEAYHETNVDGAHNLLSRLPAGARTVLLSSQSAGGPTPAGVSARDESCADHPITLYGRSKLEMERRVTADFPDRDITILRPPMILGPRDTATLPLFQMASGLARIKPGLRAKTYSWIAVDDLVPAILMRLAQTPSPSPGVSRWNVASGRPITDLELLSAAASATGGRGITLRLPHAVVGALGLIVDAVPGLGDRLPSLTRDRIREIWPGRWVMDSGAFRRETGWADRRALADVMSETCRWYRAAGLLAPGR